MNGRGAIKSPSRFFPVQKKKGSPVIFPQLKTCYGINVVLIQVLMRY